MGRLATDRLLAAVKAAEGDQTRLVVNLPNREHWLAPERREATFAFLAGHACGFGVLTLGLLAGVHWLLLDANRASPPHLATAPFVALLATFFVLLAVWMVTLFRRFRTPR